jgi:hypothetical protein
LLYHQGAAPVVLHSISGFCPFQLISCTSCIFASHAPRYEQIESNGDNQHPRVSLTSLPNQKHTPPSHHTIERVHYYDEAGTGE